MKTTLKRLSFIVFAALAIGLNARAQIQVNQVSIFPRGEKPQPSQGLSFTGNVWVNVLSANDATFHYQAANVTFEPKARTYWHIHPGGQILLVTAGTGYYQEKGKPKQTLRAGDVVKCLANIQHWHGATPDGEFSHIGITNDAPSGRVVWLEPVTDEEYSSLK